MFSRCARIYANEITSRLRISAHGEFETDFASQFSMSLYDLCFFFFSKVKKKEVGNCRGHLELGYQSRFDFADGTFFFQLNENARSAGGKKKATSRSLKLFCPHSIMFSMLSTCSCSTATFDLFLSFI